MSSELHRRPERVVFVTQQLDPSHRLLATTIPQVEALARRVEELVVIADRVVEGTLPANARARTFAAGSRPGRGLRLLEALARELPGLRRGRSAVIVHMVPNYAIVAAPLVRPARLPLVIWWTHWKLSAPVRGAELVCTAVCTVNAKTFPLASRKLHAIGHGIDVQTFAAIERPSRPAGAPLRVLVASRYSPAKGIEQVLRATALARDRGLPIELSVHGPATNAEEVAEKARLGRVAHDLGLDETLGGPLARSELVSLLAASDVLVNNALGADRIGYEAAASALPVLSSNDAYGDVLEPELFFARGDPVELASRFGYVASLDTATRAALGERLRERVARLHSLETWSAGLLRAAGFRAE